MSDAPSDGFFDSVKVKKVVVRRGNRRWRFELPQRYYDWSFMMAHFPACSAKVRRLIPSPQLQPVQLAPGIAIVSFAAFEYRHMATLRPYNEFAIMVPVLPKPTENIPALPLLYPNQYPELGFWIRHLPVTTQEACDVGAVLWGFPKFLADISFEDVGWMRRCRLTVNGQHVMTLDVRTSETRTQARDFYAFPQKTGHFLRTRVQTRGLYDETRFAGGASYTLGEHRIARELKALGMRPVCLDRIYAFRAQSLLHRGEPLEGTR